MYIFLPNMLAFIFRSSITDKIKPDRIEDSKCDHCHEDDFQYYCGDCKKYLCTNCNVDVHKRGTSAQHNRFGADSRHQPQTDNEYLCQEHPKEQVVWFCENCNQGVCNKCVDIIGFHREHRFVLCCSKANTLLSATQEALKNAETRIPPTYNALNKLEKLQFDLGPEGILTFEKLNTNGVKHVTHREAARMIVLEHFEQIEKYIRKQKEEKLNQVEQLVNAKSQTLLNQMESLHMDLIRLDNCASKVETLTTTSTSFTKVCVESPLLMQYIKQIETEWSNLTIIDEGTIPVTVSTSNVILLLEKSCYVGGPKTPSHVVIDMEAVENQCGFGISWNCSKLDEGTPEVSSYVVEVKTVGEGETEDIPLKYSVAVPSSRSSSSPASDSDRLRLIIKDKVFEGQKVYAMVSAIDVNGASSGKGVSANVVLPDRFYPSLSIVSLGYASDFDQNGLLYYIGSAGTTQAYVNPHISGDVVVTWSTIGGGSKLENFVNNQFDNQRSATSNELSSWMMVNIGATRKISPNHYCLRHDSNFGNGYLRNWVLEGKMDDSDASAWMVLREHVNDTSIKGSSGASCSWPVKNDSNIQFFQFIRIRQTGVNSSGSHSLWCGGIELYGDLHVSLL